MQPRSHEDYFSHWLQKGMEPILKNAFYEEVLPKVFQEQSAMLPHIENSSKNKLAAILDKDWVLILFFILSIGLFWIFYFFTIYLITHC